MSIQSKSRTMLSSQQPRAVAWRMAGRLDHVGVISGWRFPWLWLSLVVRRALPVLTPSVEGVGGDPADPAMRYLQRWALVLLLLAGCAGSIADSHRRIQNEAAAIAAMRRTCLARNGTDCDQYAPAVPVGRLGEPTLADVPGMPAQRKLMQEQAALIEEQRACLEHHQADPTVDCSHYLPGGASDRREPNR